MNARREVSRGPAGSVIRHEGSQLIRAKNLVFTQELPESLVPQFGRLMKPTPAQGSRSASCIGRLGGDLYVPHVGAGECIGVENDILARCWTTQSTPSCRQLERGDISGCSTSANACGDLGWTPDSFVPPYRRQLLSAPVGSIVGPITEQNDSIFFQVEARSPHVKLTPQQLYLLRQQKFAAWVQQQQKRAKVTKYVAV